jgi:hypothetical protein
MEEVENAGSGSRERVAYDLYEHLRQHLVEPADPKKIIEAHLKLYAACRTAVRSGGVDISGLP